MMKSRWRLKIMSGPGDTRGRGVLGHDRGSLPILFFWWYWWYCWYYWHYWYWYICTSVHLIMVLLILILLLIPMLGHDRGSFPILLYWWYCWYWWYYWHFWYFVHLIMEFLILILIQYPGTTTDTDVRAWPGVSPHSDTFFLQRAGSSPGQGGRLPGHPPKYCSKYSYFR